MVCPMIIYSFYLIWFAFIKPDKIEEDHNDKLVIIKDNIHRIGSLEGQDLIDADYDIDECNGEIAEMFGVKIWSCRCV